MPKKFFIPLLLALIVLIIAAFSVPQSQAATLQGNWSGDGFQAKITKNHIRMNLVGKHESAIYWDGTFSSGTTIVSKANESVLASSLFGSEDSKKKFTYKNGYLIFKFGILGTTSTIYLHRDR